MTHIAQELRLGCIGFFGSGFLFGILLGEIRELSRLPFQRLLRFAQIDDGRTLTLFALDQLLLVLFDLSDVGSNRDVAAILGAPFTDMHPAPILELCFECTRAARLAVMGDRGADQRLSASCYDGLVG